MSTRTTAMSDYNGSTEPLSPRMIAYLIRLAEHPDETDLVVDSVRESLQARGMMGKTGKLTKLGTQIGLMLAAKREAESALRDAARGLSVWLHDQDIADLEGGG